MTDEHAQLSFEEFVPARKLYWRPGPKHISDGTAPSPEATSLVQDGSDFLLYSTGHGGLFAVFEDFDERGWFYLYDAPQQRILKSAYIYNRANVSVAQDVIDIGWAADDSCCGLAIWGEFRAFLGISNDIHIEKPLTHSNEEGIPIAKWPVGFELYVEKKIN